MRRITEQEARNFIPCSDDGTTPGQARSFTLTPTTDGWEDVNYYTGKSNLQFANRKGGYNSWVYILSNESIPGQYKIGFTDRDVESRAKEVSAGSGVPTPFKVEWAFNCWDGRRLEQEVHKKLSHLRTNNRKEFFIISLDEAKDTISNIGKNYI
jgi:hypothetical protein